jgi:hypothetical protein
MLLGHYPQAFDYYRQAGQRFGQLRQLEALAYNFNDLRALYYTNKQLGPARQQYNQALSLFRRTANANGILPPRLIS